VCTRTVSLSLTMAPPAQAAMRTGKMRLGEEAQRWCRPRKCCHLTEALFTRKMISQVKGMYSAARAHRCGLHTRGLQVCMTDLRKANRARARMGNCFQWDLISRTFFCRAH